MDQLCRLCLAVNNEVIKLFSEVAEQLNIKNIIVQHFWFDEIRNDDNLPKCICTKCWTHIVEFHEFYKTIETVQENGITVTMPVDNTSNGLSSMSHDTTIFDNDDSTPEFKINDLTLMKCNDSLIVTNNDVIENGINFVNFNDTNDININIKSEFVSDLYHEKSYNTDDNNPIDTISCIEAKLVKNNTINDDNGNYQRNKYEKEDDDDDVAGIVSINTYKKCKSKIKLHTNHGESQELEFNKINEVQHLTEVDHVSEFHRKRTEENRKIRDFFDLSCTICSEKLQTFANVLTHYRTVHNIKRGYVLCCNNRFTTRWRLLEHMIWHTNPNELTCEFCNKEFTNKRGLTMHMNFHAKPEERQYRCDICDDSFTLRYHITSHFRKKHSTKIYMEYQCKHCVKCFNEKKQLQNHVYNVHNIKNIHVCHVCAKVYKSKSACQTHFNAVHMNEVKPRVQCQLCGSLQKNERSLKYHMKNIHHNDVPIECKLCGKIKPHKRSLHNHMIYVHGSRLHKCNLCEKSFQKPLALKEHIATHTGTVLYTCSYCPTTFNSNANMYKHRKNTHHNEWLAEKLKINEMSKIITN